MRRLIVIILLCVSACGWGGEKSEGLDAARLRAALLDSYPGMTPGTVDAQPHYQQVEDRLMAGQPWPGGATECAMRLSAGGFVRASGDTRAQAPAALRGWQRGPNDARILQWLVALPGGGAQQAVRAPLPERCRHYELDVKGSKISHTVTDRPLDLGDGGRIWATHRDPGLQATITVVFAYRGVLVVITCGESDQGGFPELALRRLKEHL
ncbi:hypothetical protein SMC26_14290 [Actinomadura fulvescens]